jgi:hypothetical protein
VCIALESRTSQETLGWLATVQKRYNEVSGRAANRLAEALVQITKGSPPGLDGERIKIY